MNRHRSLIRTTTALPKSDDVYFEVEIANLGSGSISVGLTTNRLESRNLRRVGEDPGTIGLSSTYIRPGGQPGPSVIGFHQMDPGDWYEQENLTPIDTGDIIGCRSISITHSNHTFICCLFTINGELAGKPEILQDVEVFPTVGINSPGAVVKGYFREEEFRYNRGGDILRNHERFKKIRKDLKDSRLQF